MTGENKTCSSSLEPRPDAVGHLFPGTHVARCRWKHIEKRLAVVAAEDPVVEDDHRAAVRRAADEASESLLQPQGRLGKGELGIRVADLLGARRVDSVGRRRER